MTKILINAIAALTITFTIPTALKAQYSGQVKFIAQPEKGTVKVESTGFAAKKTDSDADAVSNALYILLFRGLPGSPYDLPMISDEAEKKEHPVVRDLLHGGAASFITEDLLSYTETRKKKKDGPKGVLTVHILTINVESLQKYLSDKSVIKKFGY